MAQAETLARQIADKGLSVREAEALARKATAPAPTSRSDAKIDKDADTRALEKNISDALGLAVSISHRGDKGGEVKVAYRTLEQLDEICRRLAHGKGPVK